jgi:thioredoxin-dependent peroxiredoxin
MSLMIIIPGAATTTLARFSYSNPTGNTMKTHIFALLCFIAISLPAFGALKAGDTAPDFEAKASLAGEAFDFSLREALDEGTVVVYFYPSAYTQGCNIQAREFAVNMDAFEAAGASVIGVSLDSIERLNDFSADPEYCAGKLAVASDERGAIAKSFDLEVQEGRAGIKDTRGVEIDHGFAERTTFIVTPDGKIAETIGGLSPMENVQKSLEAVQRLQHTARH